MDIELGNAPRSETTAYPKHYGGFFTKIQLYLRQNTRAAFAVCAFLGFVLIASSDMLHNSGAGRFKSSFSGTLHGGYFSVADSVISDNKFRFAAVTDLDQLSLMKDESKLTFRSLLVPGTITRENSRKYTMMVDKTRTLKTKHNEAGRGAEFSELTVFDNHLLTFDDRTGEVFDIMNTKDGKESFVAPRYVVTEGEGDTDKGMKWEWSTVKDGLLYMGSMGKEYTNKDGSIANVSSSWSESKRG